MSRSSRDSKLRVGQTEKIKKLWEELRKIIESKKTIETTLRRIQTRMELRRVGISETEKPFPLEEEHSHESPSKTAKKKGKSTKEKSPKDGKGKEPETETGSGTELERQSKKSKKNSLKEEVREETKKDNGYLETMSVEDLILSITDLSEEQRVVSNEIYSEYYKQMKREIKKTKRGATIALGHSQTVGKVNLVEIRLYPGMTLAKFMEPLVSIPIVSQCLLKLTSQLLLSSISSTLIGINTELSLTEAYKKDMDKILTFTRGLIKQIAAYGFCVYTKEVSEFTSLAIPKIAHPRSWTLAVGYNPETKSDEYRVLANPLYQPTVMSPSYANDIEYIAKDMFLTVVNEISPSGMLSSPIYNIRDTLNQYSMLNNTIVTSSLQTVAPMLYIQGISGYKPPDPLTTTQKDSLGIPSKFAEWNMYGDPSSAQTNIPTQWDIQDGIQEQMYSIKQQIINDLSNYHSSYDLETDKRETIIGPARRKTFDQIFRVQAGYELKQVDIQKLDPQTYKKLESMENEIHAAFCVLQTSSSDGKVHARNAELEYVEHIKRLTTEYAKLNQALSQIFSFIWNDHLQQISADVFDMTLQERFSGIFDTDKRCNDLITELAAIESLGGLILETKLSVRMELTVPPRATFESLYLAHTRGVIGDQAFKNLSSGILGIPLNMEEENTVKDYFPYLPKGDISGGNPSTSAFRKDLKSQDTTSQDLDSSSMN